MLIELHLLTSHAPSNLNRDDFGRPKSAYFGGTERGRISSQSLKRAIRRSPYLAETLGERLSTRSLHIPRMLFNEMKEQYPETEHERLQILCEAVTHALGKPDGKNALKTSQIVFLTRGEIDRIRGFIREKMHDGTRLTAKEVKAFGEDVARGSGLDQRPSDGVDVALFGRMTTDEANAFSAVDAALQVAHPIATHTTLTETDYFTAVDDIVQEAAERGAGHIGEHDFNSAVYYKYFSCNLDLLAQNLGGELDAAVEGLTAVLDAACRVTPSGKQNSFASHSLADVALLVIRERHVPCSLANAFERPVPASENGYLPESARRLVERYCRLAGKYGFEDEAALFSVEDIEPRVPDEFTGCYEGIDHVQRLSELWDFLRRVTAGRAEVA